MIEVTIGKPIIVNQPKSTYRFSLKVMFGDGDGYDTNWVDAADPQELLPYIRMLEKYNSIGWNNQCDVSDADDWARILELDDTPDWRSKDPADRAFHTLMDMIPGDPCSDGQYQGAPDHWWISYFDADGQEYECSFTVDGAKIEQDRR